MLRMLKWISVKDSRGVLNSVLSHTASQHTASSQTYGDPWRGWGVGLGLKVGPKHATQTLPGLHPTPSVAVFKSEQQPDMQLSWCVLVQGFGVQQ